MRAMPPDMTASDDIDHDKPRPAHWHHLTSEAIPRNLQYPIGVQNITQVISWDKIVKLLNISIPKLDAKLHLATSQKDSKIAFGRRIEVQLPPPGQLSRRGGAVHSPSSNPDSSELVPEFETIPSLSSRSTIPLGSTTNQTPFTASSSLSRPHPPLLSDAAIGPDRPSQTSRIPVSHFSQSSILPNASRLEIIRNAQTSHLVDDADESAELRQNSNTDENEDQLKHTKSGSSEINEDKEEEHKHDEQFPLTHSSINDSRPQSANTSIYPSFTFSTEERLDGWDNDINPGLYSGETITGDDQRNIRNSTHATTRIGQSSSITESESILLKTQVDGDKIFDVIQRYVLWRRLSPSTVF